MMLSTTVAAEETVPASPGLVYVIPIKGEIERGLLYVIRRGVTEALDRKADAIVFDIDTPGGRVDAAEEILNIIENVDVRTYAFVNRNAISAGAIISFGTDEIWMAPGSKIGDALPIMISPTGTPAEMPEGIEEKAVSYVSGIIRSAAQRKGHDPQLAEKMVRREIEYKIGDEIIGPAKQLLTLTNVEAERMVGTKGERRRLLSRGTVPDLNGLLKEIGFEGAKVVPLQVTMAENLARFIERLSILLLAGGLLCLYIEFKTPGFGLPGICGILLLAIWFWGHHIAGLAGMGEIVLFALGLLLLVVEIVFIPGFGSIGVLGFFLMIVAMAMAMVQHYPGGPWQPPVLEVQDSVFNLGTSILVSGILMYFIARYLPDTPLFQHITLQKQLKPDAGYTAAPQDSALVGRQGHAVTPLHPGGIAEFGDQRLNVMARGQFLDAGTPIVIAEVHGNRIVVDSVTGAALGPAAQERKV